MKLSNITLISLTIFLFASCGSDSGSSAGTSLTSASFIDSPVKGLEYSSSSASGTTSSTGGLSCKNGETVTFKINSVEIGSVACASTITPLSLLGASNYSNAKALNLAYLLQSMDADQDLSNGIDITTAKSSINAIDLTNDSAIDTLVNAMPNKANVTRVSAKGHAENYEGNIGKYVTSKVSCTTPSNSTYSGTCPSTIALNLSFDGEKLSMDYSGYESSSSSSRNNPSLKVLLQSSTYKIQLGGKTATTNSTTGERSVDSGNAFYFKDTQETSSTVCTALSYSYIGHYIRVSDTYLDAKTLDGEAVVAYTVTCKDGSGNLHDYDEFWAQLKITKQFSVKF